MCRRDSCCPLISRSSSTTATSDRFTQQLATSCTGSRTRTFGFTGSSHEMKTKNVSLFSKFCKCYSRKSMAETAVCPVDEDPPVSTAFDEVTPDTDTNCWQFRVTSIIPYSICIRDSELIQYCVHCVSFVSDASRSNCCCLPAAWKLDRSGTREDFCFRAVMIV